jgi:hypothetical protein
MKSTTGMSECKHSSVDSCLDAVSSQEGASLGLAISRSDTIEFFAAFWRVFDKFRQCL